MLVLNALVCKSSDLLEFSQTHNAAMFSTKRNICFTDTSHLCKGGLGLIPFEFDTLQNFLSVQKI